MRYQQYDKESIITNVRELVEKKKMYIIVRISMKKG